MSELEEQQKKILENVRKDTNTLEKQRQRVIKELEKVNFMFWARQYYHFDLLPVKIYDFVNNIVSILGKNETI